MIQRIKRRLTMVISLLIPLFAVLVVTRTVSAASYYPDYALDTATTSRNTELAFILVAAGLLLLALDSLLYLAHFIWSRRPSARKARQRTWSQERL